MREMIQEYVKQRGRGKGAIVLTSSISGHIAQHNRWTYNMAKGAVKQLTRCAAMDLAPDIRVNCFKPGLGVDRRGGKGYAGRHKRICAKGMG